MKRADALTPGVSMPLRSSTGALFSASMATVAYEGSLSSRPSLTTRDTTRGSVDGLGKVFSYVRERRRAR